MISDLRFDCINKKQVTRIFLTEILKNYIVDLLTLIQFSNSFCIVLLIFSKRIRVPKPKTSPSKFSILSSPQGL